MGKKALKPYTARTPPVPSESHAEIEEWIRRQMPDLQPIAKLLDDVIRDTIPGLRFAIKWKKAYYGTSELGWLIEVVAYDVSVNLVFLGGADLDPPPPLGDSDRSRYVKLTAEEDTRAPAIREWIEQASREPGWR
jgi:hypothetical protein